MSLINSLRNHAANLFGYRTSRKIIVIESDDWGDARIQNQKVYIDLMNKTRLYENPYLRYDAIESNKDIEELFNLLLRFKDSNNRNPIITANFIMGNPNYNKIKEDNYSKYYFDPFFESFKFHPEYDHVIEYYNKGIEEQLFHPQLHGRDHIDADRWLKALKDGDPVALYAFRNNFADISNDQNALKRKSITAAFDFDNSSEISKFRNILIEASSIFNDLFKYNSKSFIAPAYTWSRKIEPMLNEIGIKYIQSLIFQTEPRPESEKKYGKIFHYLGQKNLNNQYYLIRNCFFEPTILNKIDWISNTLHRINIAFIHMKPAIIGTHRINYIGYHDPKNRERNLKLLEILFKQIIKRWPDVEFMSSDQLGLMIENKSL